MDFSFFSAAVLFLFRSRFSFFSVNVFLFIVISFLFGTAFSFSLPRKEKGVGVGGYRNLRKTKVFPRPFPSIRFYTFLFRKCFSFHCYFFSFWYSFFLFFAAQRKRCGSRRGQEPLPKKRAFSSSFLFFLFFLVQLFPFLCRAKKKVWE